MNRNSHQSNSRQAHAGDGHTQYTRGIFRSELGRRQSEIARSENGQFGRGYQSAGNEGTILMVSGGQGWSGGGSSPGEQRRPGGGSDQGRPMQPVVGATTQRDAAGQPGRQASGAVRPADARDRHDPKGYERSDERLREDIIDRLIARDGVELGNVEVMVVSGEVTLTGSTDERASRRLLEEIVDSVWGVKDVNNQIKVRSESAEQISEAQKPQQSADADGDSKPQGGSAGGADGGETKDSHAT